METIYLGLFATTLPMRIRYLFRVNTQVMGKIQLGRLRQYFTAKFRLDCQVAFVQPNLHKRQQQDVFAN